jgi:uncharacterized protein YutD
MKIISHEQVQDIRAEDYRCEFCAKGADFFVQEPLNPSEQEEELTLHALCNSCIDNGVPFLNEKL